MASISLAHVSKRYRDVEAVRDLSLDITDGEFVAVVGPSGCGKTTVLRLIAGLEAPDEGHILFDGNAVDDVPPRERDVAMVFEHLALYPHMAVRDTLAFPLRMTRTPAATVQRRVAEVAHSMEIDPILGRRPAALATGEAQHVAVGHAVIRERPSVFLLDDALSHLDAHQRLEARAELSRLRRDLGATVVAVTHDQAEALATGDRVAVMQDGALRQVGTPRELYEHPADVFVAGFIGSPPMNLLRMRLERGDDGWLLRQDGSTWRLPRPGHLERLPAGTPVVVGFRPEHLRVGVTADPGELGFEAVCDVSEYLGHRRLLHLRAGLASIIASVEPGLDPALGERLGCALPLDRLRFFGQETGAAI